MTTFTTTPIFYANGEPHLGHAYSGILADICHRYQRLAGHNDVLITGTDEHGKKIASTAEAHHTDIREFVDQKSAAFSALWRPLVIEPDVFVRTTDTYHKAHITEVWSRLLAKGDIYLGAYSGEYCVACEQYYSERDLNGRQCPVHGREVETISEPTYLFKLEHYRQSLLAYYHANPGVITPLHYQEAIIEQLEAGPLEDLSVSRINNNWGVEVPNDQEHTVYVWIDALFGYITAITSQDGSEQDIANTVHVLGKDILKFHALYWPCLLLALELPLPRKLVVHSWWTIEGEKISKSNPDTIVNPEVFAKRLTADGLRYALVRQKPLSRDGNVSLSEFIETVNADLANSFANLVKRNNTLITQYFAGHISQDNAIALDDECLLLLSSAEEYIQQAATAYQSFSPFEVTLALKQLLDETNGFFHHRSPWLMNKGKGSQHVRQTCFVVANIVRQIAIAISPITPILAQSVLSEFGLSLKTLKWESVAFTDEVNVTGAKSHFQRVK
ncbi:methionine--tRNA ligase [Veronia pacifica]|uniref:methionine--tRNA ligase n=1 Tax=Veronia pacifica TaxID=1080227 RepID=A0A1C3EP88_9GAMM|nr:methionine--tRNA ligase [Veronia pacifica]ODA35063.1 hypothetical protein A8L45_05130 [Veronia pacifica]